MFLFLGKDLRGRLALPLFVSALFFASCSAESDSDEQPSPDVQTVDSILQPGDIILKCGFGSVSKIITEFLDEQVRISHSAIATKNAQEETIIVHSISGQLAENDGVQTIALKRFLTDVKQGTFFILRPKANSEQTLELSLLATELAAASIPFDHDFNERDSNELYCSEFVTYAYRSVFGNDCFELHPRGDLNVYMFNSIFENEEFEVVYKW